ncbi:hypothetical protein [Xenorhabdus anantnagensis]|uniref:Uncharacterized protein n=1 Tax=Xenorhabdus anantnagensis TaxID=3025875 RepID=A0ABT5LX04_9GAMM|nr:hypothetical protein [Xenorhabdus anantnagensis]MDC9598981.1 hypothetical protein [Xenorhabdus anantnagensis]
MEGDHSPERDAGPIGERYGRREHNSKQRRVIYRVAGGGEGRRQLDNGQQESTEDHEIEYDRAGNAFIECLEAVGATIQRATQSLRAGARRLTDYVQLHCGGQRHAVETSELLKQSSERIDRATPAVREFLQAEQMLKQQKLERAEPKNKPYHSSYGPSR